MPAVRWQIPKTIQQADSSSFAKEWEDARHVELKRLQEMCTWQLVDPPPAADILGCRWVFAVKQKPDGIVDRFKARLVAQFGFGQKEGVDYDETYVNTAGYGTLRMFLSMVCQLDLHLHQMDVTTAFLYGDIDKEVFMKQPPGHSDGSDRVCKLIRSLYGLKQAPRIWNETLDRALREMSFVKSELDPALYILTRDGHVLFLLDFVDDMLLASASQPLIDWVKAQLSEKFKMTDLGEAEKYLRFYILRDRVKGEMWLSQVKYCTEIAVKFGCPEGPFPDTPMHSSFVMFYPWELPDAGLHGRPPPDSDVSYAPLLDVPSVKLYRQFTASLNYAAHTTRPDIAYAVSQLSRANHCPRTRHLKAARRVVFYLMGTAEWGLHYRRDDRLMLECFTDASFKPDEESKARTGLILSFGGGPVYWSSKKQDRVSTSTCDAESLAVMTAVQFVEFARDQLEELGCLQRRPTPLWCDNSATVALCQNPVSHHKSKQLVRPMAYVRELYRRRVIYPAFIRTRDQPADFLTKSLTVGPFVYCRDLAGLRPRPT